MIGLGTGSTNRSIKREQWDKYGSLGVVDPVNNLPLINMFFHASETALSHSLIHELGDDLYMFNKSILDGDPTTPNTQIDDGSPENLKKLRNFSEAIMEEFSTQLDDVCELLVQNRAKKLFKQDEQAKDKKGLFSFFSGEKE